MTVEQALKALADGVQDNEILVLKRLLDHGFRQTDDLPYTKSFDPESLLPTSWEADLLIKLGRYARYRKMENGNWQAQRSWKSEIWYPAHGTSLPELLVLIA